MKILLTSKTDSIDADIDSRFGRAAYLIVVDTDNGEWKAHANPGVNASGGAGIQAAQFASDQGVKAAISGDFGPNAHKALQEAGIPMYLYGECLTIQVAIQQFKAGKLVQVDAPAHPEAGGGYHK